MSGLFGDLTVPNQVVQGGVTTQYQNPAQAATMAAVESAQPTRMYDPGNVKFNDDGSIALDPATTPAVTQRPSFVSASHDPSGMPTPLSPSLTKGGKLLAILGAAAKGGLAGAGTMTFAQGFDRGESLPYIEASRQQALVHGGLENQLAGAQVAMLPWQRAVMAANLGKTQSEIGKNTAETSAANAKAVLDQAAAFKDRYVEVPGQGLFDLKDPSGHPTAVTSSQQLVPLNLNQAKVANLPEGTKVPVDFAKKLGEIADQNEMQVGANGHQYTVDKVSGRIIKDWGKANSLVNAQINATVSNPLSGVTLPLNTTGTTNDAALAKLSPLQQTAIKGIANYEIDPNAARARGISPLQAITLAKMYDPSYDEMGYANKVALRKEFTSGTTGRVIRNLNTATQHLSMLEEAIKALDNSDFPTLNKIANRLGFEVGSNKKTNFENVQNALAGELGAIYKGTGVTPDAEIERVRATIPSYGSPDQLNGGAREAIGLIYGRLDALQFQLEQGLEKPANFRLISPHSESVFKQHGIQVQPLRTGLSTGGEAPTSNVNKTAPPVNLENKYKDLGAKLPK